MRLLKGFGLVIISLFLVCGCEFKRDTMEDITIYTTVYPINYLINYLYGENSTIYSIYPAGVNIENYDLSSKKLKEYSNSDLFVFNSLDADRDYAVKMINYNSNLKIIDVSLGMKYVNSVEELWLNPYNFLMMAQNLKNGLNEYITNPYLIKEIEDNYDNLNYDLSKLDASLKETINNATYTTIVTDSDALKFLEKYNLRVISLQDDEDLVDSTVAEAKKLMRDNEVDYIYTIGESDNKYVTSLVSEYGVEVTKMNIMKSVDGEITNSNESYLTIMNNNIDLLKKELYK